MRRQLTSDVPHTIGHAIVWKKSNLPGHNVVSYGERFEQISIIWQMLTHQVTEPNRTEPNRTSTRECIVVAVHKEVPSEAAATEIRCRSWRVVCEQIVGNFCVSAEENMCMRMCLEIDHVHSDLNCNPTPITLPRNGKWLREKYIACNTPPRTKQPTAFASSFFRSFSTLILSLSQHTAKWQSQSIPCLDYYHYIAATAVVVDLKKVTRAAKITRSVCAR